MKIQNVIEHETKIAKIKIELFDLLEETVKEYGTKQVNKRFSTLLNKKLEEKYKGDAIPENHWLYGEGRRNFATVTGWLKKTDYNSLTNHYSLTVNFSQLMKDSETNLSHSVGAYDTSRMYSNDSYEVWIYSFDTVEEMAQAIANYKEQNIKRLAKLEAMNVQEIERAYAELQAATIVYNDAISPIGENITKAMK